MKKQLLLICALTSTAAFGCAEDTFDSRLSLYRQAVESGNLDSICTRHKALRAFDKAQAYTVSLSDQSLLRFISQQLPEGDEQKKRVLKLFPKDAPIAKDLNNLIAPTDDTHSSYTSRSHRATRAFASAQLSPQDQEALLKETIERIQREIQWRTFNKDTLANRALHVLARRPDVVRDNLPLLHQSGINPTYRFLVPALAVSKALTAQIGPRKPLQGSTIGIISATFSPDGSRILSGSFDGMIRIWDAATTKRLLTLKGHTNTIISATFSPDGSRIVSTSYDNTIRIWNAATGKCLHTLNGHTDCVKSATFSSDGSRIVSASSASYDTTICIWHVATGKCLHTLNSHTNKIKSAVFSPDGARIVSAAGDHTVRVWNTATGKCLHTLEGHTDKVCFAAFSPDCSHIASSSADNTIRIWNAATGKCLRQLHGHTDRVKSATFSSDGSRIVSTSYDNTICVWDAATGKCLHTLNGHTEFIKSADFNSDGSCILSSSYDNTIRIWNAATGECLRTLEDHSALSLCPAIFSPDGSHIGLPHGDLTIYIWSDYTKILCNITDQQEQGFLLNAALDWNQYRAHTVYKEDLKRYHSLIERFPFLYDKKLFKRKRLKLYNSLIFLFTNK